MDKPDVGPIEGEPPAELVIEDITVGDGDEAKPGHTVSVHYVGVAHSSGQGVRRVLQPRRGVRLPARRRPGHRRLGPGRGRHARRRPPQADHPPAPRLRRARRRRRDQAERDAHLRGGPSRRAVSSGGRPAGPGRASPVPARSPSRPRSRSCRRRTSPSGRTGRRSGSSGRLQVRAARLVRQQRAEGHAPLLAAGGPRGVRGWPSWPRPATLSSCAPVTVTQPILRSSAHAARRAAPGRARRWPAGGAGRPAALGVRLGERGQRLRLVRLRLGMSVAAEVGELLDERGQLGPGLPLRRGELRVVGLASFSASDGDGLRARRR